MNDEELDQVIQNVIFRFRELHPDYEAVFFTLPRAPGREREEAMESIFAFLQREKIPASRNKEYADRCSSAFRSKQR